MARFKEIHEMEKRGMKGTFAHDHTKAGKPKHYKFRTTSIGRQTNRQRTEVEALEANVEIKTQSEKDLLRDLPAASMDYHRFLKHL